MGIRSWGVLDGPMGPRANNLRSALELVQHRGCQVTRIGLELVYAIFGNLSLFQSWLPEGWGVLTVDSVHEEVVVSIPSTDPQPPG